LKGLYGGVTGEVNAIVFGRWDGLWLTPTCHYWEPYSRTEDDELKESVGEASRLHAVLGSVVLGF
jgi:hypothetical protein